MTTPGGLPPPVDDWHGLLPLRLQWKCPPLNPLPPFFPLAVTGAAGTSSNNPPPARRQGGVLPFLLPPHLGRAPPVPKSGVVGCSV